MAYKSYQTNVKKLCECGCGEEIVNSKNKFITGHRCVSEETREKMSIAHEGQTCSEETKKKIGFGNKGHRHSEKTKRKIGEAHKGKLHGACSEETKKKMSLANKGMKREPHSKKVKRKMSISHIKNHLKPNYKLSDKIGRGKRHHYQSPYQDRVCFRSGYELKFAMYLDQHNIDWLYEPKTFDLKTTTYLPDFYLIKDRKFIEIKGYMFPVAQNKINLFRKCFPDEKLEVLFKEDLIRIKIDV